LEDAALSLPEMSPAVERAIGIAQQLSRRGNCDQTGTVHALAALLQEEEGKASVLLAAAGLARAAALDLLNVPVASETENPPAGGPPPIGIELESALIQARSLGVELAGERMVTSEYLLIALLDIDRGLARNLADLGLRKRELELAIRGDQDVPLPAEELVIRDPVDWSDAARILDANANRAREGLRVVEDYCRFVLDDRLLVTETKQLRHALNDALGTLPIQARDTVHDVGATVSTSQERVRTSPLHVLKANLKRLQEALRSIEEYSKFALSNSGQTFEKLRYRSYTLERMLLIHVDATSRLAGARLYVLLNRRSATASLEWTIQEAVAGGATVFQLREKDYSDRELLAVARDVRRWTRETNTLFILNDRPDVARLVDADGVHLGQEDMSVKEARRILGPHALIGVSTHSLRDLQRAIEDGATYLGVGPTFTSGTKDFGRLAGLEYIREAAAATTLPWFAIGGIQSGNVADVVAAGASRIAVSRAIIAAAEPRMAAAGLLKQLAGARD
jgi:thiamine-phosphate pyrophosphorylase